MVYGYDELQVNEWGLKQMREVTFSISPSTLRKLAAFFLSAADEMDVAVPSIQWHRYAPPELLAETGCDLIVMQPSRE
jgi:hypothetical protein